MCQWRWFGHRKAVFRKSEQQKRSSVASIEPQLAIKTFPINSQWGLMFACIFIPDFMVEAVLRAEPLLRAHPLAVLDGKPPLCYVVGANEAARHLGIEVGMTKLLAETLQTPD